jgi:ABC-type transport system involved in multi-copper enzyme maturation permease subunit
VVQQAAVLLLTPVYAGGAMTDEKEHGRLDFLLTTQLSRWELVAGKLAARLTFVLAVVAAGLPVLMFTLLFGAVDPGRVLAGFAVTGITAVAVGSYAVLLSVYRPTLRDVLLWCYGTLAALAAVGLFGGCFRNWGAISPVTVLWTLVANWLSVTAAVSTWEIVRTFAVIYLPVSILCLWFALSGIRARVWRANQPTSAIPKPPEPDVPPDDPPPLPDSADPPPPDWYVLPERLSVLDVSQSLLARGRAFAVRPLNDEEDPFRWKEWHFTGRLPLMESQWLTMTVGCATTAFLFVLATGLFVGVVSDLIRSRWTGVPVNVVSRIFLVAAVLVVPVVGIRTAVSVTEERAKQTLLSLLTLPVPRRNILWAKLWGAVSRSRWLFVGIVIALALALITGAIHPAAVASTAALFVGYTAFCAAAGLWLSVRTAGSVRAVLYYLGVVFGTILLPFLAARLGVGVFGYSELWDWLNLFSPPVGLFHSTEVMLDGTSPIPYRDDFAGMLLANALQASVGLVYLILALVLGQGAEVRFEREGRG